MKKLLLLAAALVALAFLGAPRAQAHTSFAVSFGAPVVYAQPYPYYYGGGYGYPYYGYRPYRSYYYGGRSYAYGHRYYGGYRSRTYYRGRSYHHRH